MAKTGFGDELLKFKEYLKSGSVENARRALLYPLFQKLFKDKFKIENDANGGDVYIVGQLIVESKTSYKQWTEGLFQALHYHRKFGLAYHTVLVTAREFVGIWKVNKLPERVVKLIHTSDVHKPASTIGKELAKQCSSQDLIEIKESANYWLSPKDLVGDIFGGAKNLTTETYEILKILKNLDSDRQQINTHNFIDTIERMKTFFPSPIEAVHAFYTIVAFWDITSKVTANEDETEVQVIGFKEKRNSAPIPIHRNKIQDFSRFVETQYVFTNEGSGLTVDYYFGRFDEVLSRIDPQYVKQHGIFFTNNNLSKFSLWFAKTTIQEDINENYIVFDPAAGSGNLVSSWKGKLKHKIVSELQPDLLKIIERRMRADPWHIEHGFTIVPRTSNTVGLNFLDKSAEEYLNILEGETLRNHVSLDKPFAFLLNPPYKNTDENESARVSTQSEYSIHQSILEITGDDAGKERYLAFLGQILNMSQIQAERNLDVAPIVMIFTPTSWLIPRPTYEEFRNTWDAYFKFQGGFIVTSNAFFKLEGKWPLAFTIWKYSHKPNGNSNVVEVTDLTGWKASDLNIIWEVEALKLDRELNDLLKGKPLVKFDNSRGYMKNWVEQKMYDFKRDKTKQERNSNDPVGGLPLTDPRRNNKKTYGTVDSDFIGFMDDSTPVRVNRKLDPRYNSQPSGIWFRIDTGFIDINKSKCFNGPPDQKGYCAYDLVTAQKLTTWFAITKVVGGQYPMWANQNDIWKPNIPSEYEKYWYSLCFAFVLAENRCVVTKFESNNPVIGAPEVIIDNPLCPTNTASFWSLVLLPEISHTPENNAAKILIDAVTDFYKYWNKMYCKGQIISNVGLHNEPYFRYFDYPDFVTYQSGIIQIRKFAEENASIDLINKLDNIQILSKKVKDELSNLLINKFKYFE